MIIKSLLIALLAVYPFIVYFGLQQFSPRVVGILLFVLLLLRLLLMGKTKIRPFSQAMIAPAIACAISFIVAISDNKTLLLYNPVIVSSTLLYLFSRSLWHPPSVIEKFARISKPDLSAAAIAYCRKVNQVWCAFFALNAMVAFYTIMIDDMEIWTVYNGLISYLLMGALFGGELVVRRFVR